jgi:hypothetical protein
MAFILVYQIIFPTVVLGLTTGPYQPEYQNFAPSESTEMVNLFTGDFSYNIPLLDIEGYPINISYSDNITMDQEASWVGLGWSLNPGVMNRIMRGVPDDFSGVEKNKTVMKLKPDNTKGARIGMGVALNLSLFILGGGGGVNAGLGVFNNTYRGTGLELSIDAYYQINSILGIETPGGSIGANYNTQQGLDLNSSRTRQSNSGVPTLFTLGGKSQTIVSSYNSRQGQKQDMQVNTKTNGLVVMGIGQMSGTTVATVVPAATPVYTPQIPIGVFSIGNSNRTAFSYTQGFSLSASGVPLIGAGIGGNISKSKYTTDQFSQLIDFRNSYGYIYSEKALNSENVIYDFSRSSPPIFTPGTPSAPVTSFNYDIYTGYAQGLSSVYRPHRNDIGTVSDPQKVSIGFSSSNGTEHSVSAVAGYDVVTQVPSVGGFIYQKVDVNGFSFNFAKSKIWNSQFNIARYHFLFDNSSSNGTNSGEKFYFKKIGENVVFDSNYFNQFGGDDPIRVVEGNLFNTGNGFEITTLNQLEKQNINGGGSSRFNIPSSNSKSTRQKRAEVFYTLTASEASIYGLDKNILSYKYYGNEVQTTSFNRIRTFNNPDNSTFSNTNHISEVNVLKTDGSRYIYGIPIYNLEHKEITFNATGGSVGACNSADAALISFSANDITINNNKGYDNLYHENQIPPYSTNYLLTAVVSPDYVDVSDNGLSEDDLGTYTKFNYTKINGNYNWRMPYGANKAIYSKGFNADEKDDKGSIMYGSKELWYLHSIETKNYIAEFYTSNRNDGLGVDGVVGNMYSGVKLQRLDSICLYEKHERLTNPNAVPIKKIHFNYSYSLISGTPNSTNGGRLTLESISFSYQNSNKGRLSPYVFTYNQGESYKTGNSDRWGNYKTNDCNLSNEDYPYAEQNKALADTSAKYWKLKTIQTPTGSLINIEYESDDYSYVQDKNTMGMYKINSVKFSDPDFSLVPELSGGNSLYALNPQQHKLYLSIEVPEFNNLNLAQKYDLAFRMLKDIKYLYYKINVNYKNNKTEFVPGFAEVDVNEIPRVFQNSNELLIKLKPVFLEDDAPLEGLISPIAYNVFQYARLNLPRLIWPDISFDDPLAMLQSIQMDIQIAKSKKLNKYLLKNGFAQTFNPNKSFVRLNIPLKTKLGGGSRVKQITINDNWGTFTNNSSPASTYGQKYTYTTFDESLGKNISSGVASYEPVIGKEENPFFEPVFFSVKNLLLPDDHHYHTKPFTEDHFPSPIIGYSKVTVENISHTNVTRNATGKTEFEFYTSFDFPTRTYQTDFKPTRTIVTPTEEELLNGKSSGDYVSNSQGFVIERNNMHGQIKGHKVYDANGALIKNMKINFKTKADNNKRLENEVWTLNKSGIFSLKILGKDMELISEMNNSISSMNATEFQTIKQRGLLAWNTTTNTVFQKFANQFASTALTKVIDVYGIIDNIITNDNGVVVENKFLAYDDESGEVILTSTKNEFGDPIYTFNYPGYFAYPNMGAAYKNIGRGFTFSSQNVTNGIINITNASSFFTSGDEIAISNNEKAWVVEVNSNSIKCIYENGNLVNNSNISYVKIIRSGYRNMLTSNIGSVQSLQNPKNGTSLSFNQIINSSAVEYFENGKYLEHDSLCTGNYNVCAMGSCDLINLPSALEGQNCNLKKGSIINPYIYGFKGAWKLQNSYQYYTDRTNAGNIKTDGVYTSYNPYWINSGGSWSATTNTEWVKFSEAVAYSSNGFLLESKDAINRFSSSIYGYGPYNPNLLIAQATNSRNSDIAFDGFEDYYFQNGNQCVLNSHFNFQRGLSTPIGGVNKNEVSSNFSHTGNYSLKIIPESNHSSVRKMYDYTSSNSCSTQYPYVMDNCDLNKGFNPKAGKYIFSCWVKETNPTPQNTYTNSLVKIFTIQNSSISDIHVFYPTGPIINGWQRIEGVVDLSSYSINEGKEVPCIVISLINRSTARDVYFDDVRMHPYKSSMTAYVYDSKTLRLMAQLDDYNYATIYQYDEEGTLVRMNAETEKGIYTVREQRSSLYKN